MIHKILCLLLIAASNHQAPFYMTSNYYREEFEPLEKFEEQYNERFIIDKFIEDSDPKFIIDIEECEEGDCH